MSYDVEEINKLIELCDELYNYTLNYNKINGSEVIYKNFSCQLKEFEDKHIFMKHNYAPRDILHWFGRHDYWEASDLRMIKAILEQIKREYFVSEEENIDPLNLWNFVHCSISSISKKKIMDGHYADAVESAMKAVNARVKRICLLYRNEEKDGVKLMQYVFSASNPLLKFEDINTENGQNVQIGYMQMFAGAIQGLRNPKAHDNLYITKESAMKQIVVASFLMDKIDEALIFTGISEE